MPGTSTDESQAGSTTSPVATEATGPRVAALVTPAVPAAAAPVSMKLRPLGSDRVLKDRVYEALKAAITAMDIYGTTEPLHLDERRLGEELGVSRTPVREALARLDHEGLVTTIPHRGAFVVRKTKAEILDLIAVWAALESMAARLATEQASDEEIARLRMIFVTFEDPKRAQAEIDEYSDTNIRFHQQIIALGKNPLLETMADELFVHMRAIRVQTITERDRAARSVIDHVHIIEAIERRDAELAARLVREHSLGLARHISEYVDYLE